MLSFVLSLPRGDSEGAADFPRHSWTFDSRVGCFFASGIKSLTCIESFETTKAQG